MSGISHKTKVIALRLPNQIYDTLVRRAKKNSMTLTDYLRSRILADTNRKYEKLR